jgi:hypothetical protein
MVEHAVITVRSPGCDVSVQSDVRRLIMDLLSAGTGPRGLSLEEIIRLAQESGISREASLAAIGSLITEDECYQPQKGFVKLL